MYHRRLFSDICIVTSRGTIYFHKALIAVRCPDLSAHLDNLYELQRQSGLSRISSNSPKLQPRSSKTTSENIETLHLPDIQHCSVEQFIESLYSDGKLVGTKNVVKAIEDLPHIPQVPQLMYEDFVPREHSSKPGSRDTSRHRLYGSMPSSSFMRALGSDKDHDTVFGIRMEKDVPYIGRLPVEIDNNDIIIEGDRYEGTPGLWELIQSKDPQDNNYTAKDFIEYAKILWATDAMKRDNDPSARHPKSNRGTKWAKIVKPIWENKSFQGSGTVFLPQDPTALIDRLELLQASKQAGNTGVTPMTYHSVSTSKLDTEVRFNLDTLKSGHVLS